MVRHGIQLQTSVSKDHQLKGKEAQFATFKQAVLKHFKLTEDALEAALANSFMIKELVLKPSNNPDQMKAFVSFFKFSEPEKLTQYYFYYTIHFDNKIYGYVVDIGHHYSADFKMSDLYTKD